MCLKFEGEKKKNVPKRHIVWLQCVEEKLGYSELKRIIRDICGNWGRGGGNEEFLKKALHFIGERMAIPHSFYSISLLKEHRYLIFMSQKNCLLQSKYVN